MRSLVIMEVEHGEDTDSLEHFIGTVRNVPVLMSPGVSIIDYTVRVDIDPYMSAINVNAIINHGKGY